ncbi:MAG: hypothetical protein ABEJ69_00140 [Candidatus Nanohaloarchaea archaeon]
MEEVNKHRYAFAALLTVLVFLLGVFVSNFVDGVRADSLAASRNDNLVDLESQQLQLSYLQSGDVQSCSPLKTGLKSIVEDYNSRLGSLQNYEDGSFFRKDVFKDIKHRYILSGIRYWMFAQDLRERCDYNASTVLFFTNSLDKEGCNACARQGQQLDYLKEKYEEDLLVFTIPTSMDDGMIDILEDQYNVTEEPVVVVNGEHVLRGYHYRADIEKYLDTRGGDNG